MNLDELLQFIDDQDNILINVFHKNEDTEKILLFRIVKLTEEVGELSEAVLSSINKQGSYKDAINKDELEMEVADVIICALLIAKTVNCDVKKCLRKKMEKITKRFKDYPDLKK